MKKIFFVLTSLMCFLVGTNAFALCANSTTFAAGQVLTAGALNTLQTNYTNCVNDVLNGDTFTGTINLHSAADLNIYSDTGATLKASIDGSTGAAILGLTQEGQMTNCGMSNSGTTFSIHGSDGAALSAANPCVVAVRSSTAGRTALAYFTANVTFTHGAASDTDGNLFGITDANWANNMPFFIGIVYNGTTPYFTISRLPYVQTGGAGATLCQKGDADCDANGDIMILATGLTLASFTSLEITQIGWFNMTYATAGGAWTAVVDTTTGFNLNYEKTKFTFPTLQMGADNGHMANNAGTAPTWNTDSVVYFIDSSLTMTLNYNLEGDGGADGAGVVTSLLYTPYFENTEDATNTTPACTMYLQSQTTLVGDGIGFASPSQTAAHVLPFYQASLTSMGLVKNSFFSNGGRSIHFYCMYKVL